MAAAWALTALSQAILVTRSASICPSAALWSGGATPHTGRSLSVAEVCSELGLSRFAIYDLIRRGDLHAVRLTRRLWRVERACLDDYLRQRTDDTQMKETTRSSSTG
jgi:excisionase family DNA binding protein